MLSNRGPRYIGGPANWRLEPSAFGEGSNTLSIHGNGRQWRGNVAFNDNHVEQVNVPDPSSTRRAFRGLPAGAATQADNVFVNENDRTGVVQPESQPGLNKNIFLRGYRNVQASSGGVNDVRVTPFWD